MQHIFEQKIKTLSIELVKALMAHQGHKIAQIYVLRRMVDMDLLSAKRFIEDLWGDYRPK